MRTNRIIEKREKNSELWNRKRNTRNSIDKGNRKTIVSAWSQKTAVVLGREIVVKPQTMADRKQ